MKKTFKVMTALTLLAASSWAISADLETSMGALAANYKIVLKTDSIDTFKMSLQKMHQAAIDSQQGTPAKLAGKDKNSPEMQQFREGMSTLTSQIEQAMALANEGKLEEARKVAQEFKQTRDVNHKKFR